MKCAAIDIGTYTVLLFVADTVEKVISLADISITTRLGEGLAQSGHLSSAAMNRTLEALKIQCDTAKSHGVEHIISVGTSALRDAANSDSFIDMVHNECGIDIKIIDGNEEAYFAYLSARECAQDGDDPFLIADIGGGSTELITGDRERYLDAVSLPLGAVRLTEMFLQNDPPEKSDIERMRGYIRSQLTRQVACYKSVIIGTGGTIAILAAIALKLGVFEKERIEGHRISLKYIREIVSVLQNMSISEKSQLEGMEKGREGIITQGVILLEEIMDFCQADTCVVHTGGVRRGVIIDYVEKHGRCSGGMPGSVYRF